MSAPDRLTPGARVGTSYGKRGTVVHVLVKIRYDGETDPALDAYLRIDDVTTESWVNRDAARREVCEITALARDGDFDGPSCAKVAAEHGWSYLYPGSTS